MYRYMVVLFLVMSGFAHADPDLYKYQFTVHTEDFLPKDDLEALSFQDERVILFLKWKGLNKKDIHEIRYVIKDGHGKTIKDVQNVFKAPSGRRNTWVKYTFKTDKDFPGDWFFYVFLNGKKYLKQMVYVSE